VRMVLLPAFMHVMGRWNWWSPNWLVWLHARFGISEGSAIASPLKEDDPSEITEALSAVPT
jgi:hypothetical protein